MLAEALDLASSDDSVEMDQAIVIELTEEATPLGDGLPKTGQLPSALFLGLGSLLSAAGLWIKRK